MTVALGHQVVAGHEPRLPNSLLGAKSADDFVHRHFSKEHLILKVYLTLRNPGIKTQFVRYLVMWAEGGVYSDLDMWALKSIDDWVTQSLSCSFGAVSMTSSTENLGPDLVTSRHE